MSLEEEKRFVVLLAVAELGGSATKRAVLDSIQSNGYLALTDEDRSMLDTRAEERWRNDLAYVRQHLVALDHLDGMSHGKWQITKRGRDALRQLSRTAIAGRTIKATAAAISAAKLLPDA